MNIQQIVDFAQVLTEAERYRPAAEKVLKGDPEQAVYNHYSSPCEQFAAGVWEGEVGQWKVNYTEHEYCEILQGVIVMTEDGGEAQTVRAGAPGHDAGNHAKARRNTRIVRHARNAFDHGWVKLIRGAVEVDPRPRCAGCDHRGTMMRNGGKQLVYKGIFR